MIRAPSVYFCRVRGHDTPIKIGYSANTPRRVGQLQTGSPFKLELVRVIPAEMARVVETSLHQKYQSARVYREWFRIDESVVNFEYNRWKRHPDTYLNSLYRDTILTKLAGVPFGHINRLVEVKAEAELDAAVRELVAGRHTPETIRNHLEFAAIQYIEL
jgi:hypothetical protein